MTEVTSRPRQGALSRRGFLGLGAGVAAAAALGACGTGGGSGGSSGAVKTLNLPAYVPPRAVDGAVVSAVEGVPTAYTSFGTPYRSVPGPPGKGGVARTFQPLFRPPPPPLPNNPWWQALNQRLGVEVQPTLSPGASYPDKLATTVAGGDIPDLTVVSTALSPGATKLVSQGAFLDLSDRLGGDGIRDFPNLAAIPTQAWRDAAVENRIYGVPMPIANNGWLYRQDWAATLGYPDPPTNADEAKELLTAFTRTGPDGRSDRRTYAFSAFEHGTDYTHQMFQVPNNWRVAENGDFTSYIESDEYERSLRYARELWQLGAWHPDAPTQQGEQQEDLWLSGQSATYELSMATLYQMFFVEGSKVFLPPSHDGGEQKLWRDRGMFAFTALPSTVTDDARIEELLGILNWWAGPFGSEEYLHIAYGLEGRQFNFVDGEPVPVEDEALGTERNLYWMVQQFEGCLYFPGRPERAAEAQQQLETIFTHQVADPSVGLLSDTDVSRAASLSQLIEDYEIGIITGRRDIAELGDLRSRWASSGGDQVKREYAESYRAANG